LEQSLDIPALTGNPIDHFTFYGRVSDMLAIGGALKNACAYSGTSVCSGALRLYPVRQNK
jgi:hypothetical protein